ncbi:hypothetical protein KSP40_PGU021708 [Platanthera guangdongensis]|uniref:Uncharacterized protein n=1 Tax=Platanthera guangdongensis TaxID=2320717 RepID=A0ABR2M6J2_9ASPA
MLRTTVGSVKGCLFLLLSMVNVTQILLCMLLCGISAAVRSIVALLNLLCIALAVYILTTEPQPKPVYGPVFAAGVTDFHVDEFVYTGTEEAGGNARARQSSHV